ncbi:MAG: aldo/keto reductase [Gammaproteobacteria bacterium]
MAIDKAAFTRRRFLRALAGAGVAVLSPHLRGAVPSGLVERAIPVSGERIPVIGMGTWGTFDVRDDPVALPVRRRVLQAFFEQGGALIDASPMYASSEYVLGELLPQVGGRDRLFAATKVWTLGKSAGERQMERSREFWGVERFDLMQIHNLLDWRTHLDTLRDWKAAGRIRYIGITTSHGRRHDELEQALNQFDFDFVQFTYNILDREAERRLLPLAQERGIAVIANRPFRRGALFGQVQGRALPDWAAEFDCANWAQFLLKFIVSHPAVTCAIPATSKPAHMLENMGAAYGRLPDAQLRQRMIEHVMRL